MELELETKIMSDAGERILKEEKMESIEKELASFEIKKGKLQRKLDSVTLDLKNCQESNFEECKELRGLIKEQNQIIIDLRVGLAYQKEINKQSKSPF